MEKLSTILNYAVRILVVLIGIIMLAGILPMPKRDPVMLQTMGVLFILFGLYRLATFHFRKKELEREHNGEEE